VEVILERGAAMADSDIRDFAMALMETAPEMARKAGAVEIGHVKAAIECGGGLIFANSVGDPSDITIKGEMGAPSAQARLTLNVIALGAGEDDLKKSAQGAVAASAAKVGFSIRETAKQIVIKESEMTHAHPSPGGEKKMEDYRITSEPFYLPINDEVSLFKIAYENRLPLMLKGPTGCGKTRFMSHMAYKLNLPLITVACHEDLTSSDLVGRYLLDGASTRWQDGPLSLAVRYGGICYLDEIVEARKDTTVVIHPLTDDRRVLPLEKRGQILEAKEDFMLAISYNPGYQTVLKDLKQSTKQRFVTIEFDFPPAALEEEIVMRESGVAKKDAADLRKVADKFRSMKNRGLDEGVSTRLMIYAGTLIRNGVAPRRACSVAMIDPITDDHEIKKTLEEIVSSIL